MVATISGVLSAAIEEGILTVNPAARPGKFLKVGDNRDKIDFLSAEDTDLLLKATAEHLSRFHPFLMTALRTGMRQGELVALHWGDIDWHGKFVEVRQSCWQGNITTPKNGKARRVDMSDQLMAVLRSWKGHRAQEALSKGECLGDLVFPSDTGSYRDPSHIRRDLNFVLGKAKLRHVRFHDLRHTYASLLLHYGESPVYVKEQMGQHSIKVTVDTYGHLIPGANRQAVNRLDDPMWNSRESAPQTHSGKKEGSAACANPSKNLVELIGIEPTAS